MAVSLETLLKRSADRLGAVHPQIREYSFELIRRAYKEGIRVQLSSGFRSNTDQAYIYGQGRPNYMWNGKKYGRAGKIVSKAKPGSSVHNYALAIDYFLVSEDGQTSLWVVNNQWRRVAAIAKSMGWEWGGDWASFRDYPHLQITGGLSIAQLATGKRPTIRPLSNVTPIVNNPWNKGYLDIGDTGPAIGQLQKDLNTAGANPPLAIDNNFGVAVKNRVITFQKQNDLEDDGIYGAASAAKMKAVLARLAEPKAKPSSTPKEEPKVTKPREVSASHAAAWKWAEEQGYLNGDRPGDSVTREQFATVLKRVADDSDVLKLSETQREEYTAIFKLAREKDVFTSDEHEKAIVDGSMTKSRLAYLQMVISGAALNGGARVK